MLYACGKLHCVCDMYAVVLQHWNSASIGVQNTWHYSGTYLVLVCTYLYYYTFPVQVCTWYVPVHTNIIEVQTKNPVPVVPVTWFTIPDDPASDNMMSKILFLYKASRNFV
jgi:hypothetical protein